MSQYDWKGPICAVRREGNALIITDERGKERKIGLWRLVARKIAPAFLMTPEGDLMFAVVFQALVDAYKNGDKDAMKYLKYDLCHAEAAGADPDWIRDIIYALELDL